VMGSIGLFYPNFTVFIVLGHKGNLVSSFPINRTPRVGGEASIEPSLSHPSYSCFVRGVGVLHSVRLVPSGGEGGMVPPAPGVLGQSPIRCEW
jgi:hypothetical protein